MQNEMIGVFSGTWKDGDCGDLFTVDRWMSDVDARCFIDDDGYGVYAVMVDGTYHLYPQTANPSQGLSKKPKEATHIVWYNK